MHIEPWRDCSLWSERKAKENFERQPLIGTRVIVCGQRKLKQYHWTNISRK